MNTIIRTTCIYTFEELNDTLKAAVHAHGVKFGLGDITLDLMMLCETISVVRKVGL